MEEKIIEEYGCSQDDSLHKVIKSFYLPVRNGPLEPIPVGSICRLKQETAIMAFYSGKAEPLEIGSTFEVLHDFQTVGPDGLWIRVSQGDELKLDRSEAVELLRKGMVREKKGE